MNLERLYVFSLIAGFVFSLSLYLSGGRFRIPFFRRLLRRRKTRAHGAAVPAPFGIFFTALGLSGLLYRTVLHWQAGLSLAAAAATGAILHGLAYFLLSRFFADTAETVTGSVLQGLPAQVSLAIPEGGTGRIAYVTAGKRVTVSARSLYGDALPQGERVIIVEFRDRIALVDRV